MMEELLDPATAIVKESFGCSKIETIETNQLACYPITT